MRKAILATLGVVMLLAGCVDNGEERELRANHAVISTQIADLRMTATVQTARIAITTDYLGTEVSIRATQSQFLQATLVERGTPENLIAAFRREVLENFAPPPTANADGSPILPTSPPVTPLAPIAPPMPTALPADAPRLENVVTSTGVGRDDCATNVVNTFDSTTPAIYVVALAINVPRGTAIASRWFRGSEQVVRFEFTPTFDITRACVWFFIDQSDVRFEAGRWSVVLDLNGKPATAPTDFTIVAR